MVKIAICDDNQKDIEIIQKFLIEYMYVKDIVYSIAIFISGEELLVTNSEFDFIFLDIAMGLGMNGIVAGRKFKSFNQKTKIIYITSFPQYCQQAINNVHAFAYLEKPIQKKYL